MALGAVLLIVLEGPRGKTDVELPWLLLLLPAAGFTATQTLMAMAPNHLLRHAVHASVIGTVL
jgi:hypothetical protein